METTEIGKGTEWLEGQVDHLLKVNRELETNMLKQELQLSVYMIRIQNYPEQRSEDTREELVCWIAVELDIKQRTISESA